MAEITCIWDAKALLGEGPTWVSHESVLYWVDIKTPAIHRYDPQTHSKQSWPMTEKIGCLVYRPGDGFLAGLESGFARIEFGSPGTHPKVRHISNPEPELAGNRFNDGKLDAHERLWAGTMDDAEKQRTGSWWVLDKNDNVQKVDDGYQVTNGPTFDLTRNRVYLTDSAAQTVFCADLVPEAGITNKQIFLQFGQGDGYPDGMTTDTDGNLWIAFWDGACLRKFTPEGALLKKIDMPVPRPTSLTFDETGKRLFVTSARIGLSERELEASPLSGALFEVEMN